MTATPDLSRFPGLAHCDFVNPDDLPSRISDLATTFPLLFYMLARNLGPFAVRAEVMLLAETGASLSKIAHAYGLPLCLRQIPPEACVDRLLWTRWSKKAAPLLANHIPDDTKQAADWLATVFRAARACDEEFAVWIASQRQLHRGPRLEAGMLLPLAVFAWHSLQKCNPLADITIAPWTPRLGMTGAMEQAEKWLTRLQVLAGAGSYPITDTWLAGDRVGNLDFVPIDSCEMLATERRAMRNCLHTYVDKLSSGACRVFAVKREGRSVATLEIMRRSNGTIVMTQLKGPGNAAPERSVQVAAETWLRSQKRKRSADLSAASQEHGPAKPVEELLDAYRRATGAISPEEMSTGLLLRQISRLRRYIALTSVAKAPSPVDLPRAAGGGAPESPEARRVHATLRAMAGADVYASWFTHMRIEGFEAGVVRASLPVRFLRAWIERHYMQLVQASCRAVWPGVERV